MLVAITGLVILATAIFFNQFPQIWAMLSWFRSQTSPAEDRQNASVQTHDISSIANGSLKKDEEASPDTTPKATARDPPSPVPTFSLVNGAEDDEQDELPPPQFPAVNSAQRASPSSLMPPPSLPSSSMPPPPRPRLTTSNSLRIPSTGPLPARGPMASSSSLPLPSAVPVTRSRKVVLPPGHSPLDWANLTRSHPNLAGTDLPGKLLLVTPSMLKMNNGRKGRPCWSSFRGKVYNLTPYVPFHPGGEGEIRRAAGKDGEKLFNEVHPWVNWDNMLGACVVGILVSEGDRGVNAEMEDVD